MAPVWAKILVVAAFGVSWAEEDVMCEQECNHEVSLLQANTQLQKARAHMKSAAQADAEVDDSVLMQTQAQVTAASSPPLANGAKGKAAALFAAGSSLLAPKSREVNAYFRRRQQQNMSEVTADRLPVPASSPLLLAPMSLDSAANTSSSGINGTTAIPNRCIAAAVIGAGVSVVSVPFTLAMAGFGGTGVSAGSLAAAWQASMGNVAGGSIFAVLQSWTMGGMSIAGTATMGGTVAAALLPFCRAVNDLCNGCMNLDQD